MTTDQDRAFMTIEQLSKAVEALTDRAMVHEGLLSDCLALFAAVDREAMAVLRDESMRAAARLQDTPDASEAAQWRPYWTGRALLLEAVLARAGSAWTSGEVIDLADAKERLRVRWSASHPAANRGYGPHS